MRSSIHDRLGACNLGMFVGVTPRDAA